jgi:Spy/CpxP family protein refolding chaperone
MQADAKTLRANQQESAKLRRELREAVLSGSADEAAIRQKSEAIAKLDGELLAARMAALAKVAATLTPEQKEKIKEVSKPPRNARPGLGAGRRDGDALRPPPEPAAPPPPEK